MTRDCAMLDLWDQAACAPPWQRDDALLAAAGTAPQGLGARNAALLALRSQLFGNRWRLRSSCPDCGADCEFEVDCSVLLPPFEGGTDGGTDVPVIHSLHIDEREIRFRLPQANDVREAARERDAQAAAHALLRRCVLDDAVAELSSDALDALSSRMEALDPGAHLSFALACPECGHAWAAPVDVGEVLWSELQAAAERMLLEVDALARTYGWSEPQVLALSPTRRAAYLQLAGAA